MDSFIYNTVLTMFFLNDGAYTRLCRAEDEEEEEVEEGEIERVRRKRAMSAEKAPLRLPRALTGPR